MWKIFIFFSILQVFNLEIFSIVSAAEASLENMKLIQFKTWISHWFDIVNPTFRSIHLGILELTSTVP